MSIFISYSRRDADFVRRLHLALEARQRDTWVDWEGIPPSAEWMREIEAAIDAAEAVVFVISPDAVASAVCLRELAHAEAQNKRLLPVVCRDTDAAAVPLALARLNWVRFDDRDGFDDAVCTLLQAVDTDLDWVRAHTRLLLRATEWASKARNPGLALHGSELEAAEQWLVAGPTKEPRPTALQTTYVIESRRRATRRRMQFLGATTAAAIVIAVLGTLFIHQRQETARQEALATARRLAAVAERVREQPSFASPTDNPLETSLQLAAEALRRLIDLDERSLEVELALRRALGPMPFAVPTPAPDPNPRYDFEQVVFTSDRLAAVSGEPFSTHRWDAQTLQPLPGRLHGFEHKPKALSPDGQFVATTPRDDRESAVDIWAIDGPAPLSRIPAGPGTVGAVALLPGGAHAVVSTRRYHRGEDWTDYATALWRTRDPEIVARLPGVEIAHPSADGRHLAGHLGERLLVWETQRLLAGDLAPRIDLGPASWSEFSADGRHLIVFRDDPSADVEVWSVASWQPTARLPEALTGRLGPDSRLVAVLDASDRKLLRIVEVATRREQARIFAGIPGPQVAFSSDGKRVAVGGLRRIDVWLMPEPGGAAATLAAGPITQIAFDAGSRRLLLLDPAGIRSWEVGETQASARRDWPMGGEVRAVSADGRRVAVASGDGRVIVAGAGDGDEQIGIPLTGPVHALALSPGARFLAVATAERRLLLAQTAPAQVLASIALPGEATPIELAVSDEGDQVVALMRYAPSRIGERMELLVWQRGAASELSSMGVGRQDSGLAANVCALGPQGRRIAVSNSRTSVQVRDARSGSELLTADEAGGRERCTFSPDERYLAITGADDSVRVWDVEQRREIARLESLPNVAGLAFSPDMRTLATLSSDGTVQTWALGYRELLESACLRLRSNLSDHDWARYIGGTRNPTVACPGLATP